MRHLQIDNWSQRQSFLHRCDARAKLLCLFFFLLSLSTAPINAYGLFVAQALLLAAGLAASRLPAAAVLARAGIVLPFTFTFAVVSIVVGDIARAEALLLRTYLSAVALVLVNATTPLPRLMSALISLRVPAFLVTVIQFVYRYLFVLIEQALQLRWAILARGGWRNANRSRSTFQAASAALAVLFQQSMLRAGKIHQSMSARGFSGSMPSLAPSRLRAADYALMAGVGAVSAGLRWMS